MSAATESMYKQYMAWYLGHRARYGQNTAVLMQVGKFFEVYDRLDIRTNTTNTNIREIADLCSLNLSESRDPENAHLLKLFGGFPEPSLPKFERQLLDAGYTVVVVVQKKNVKGDVEERIVERISSPGVFENRYTAISRLPDTNESCLIGLLLEPNQKHSYYVGVTAIDIQTGDSWSTETDMPFLQNTPNIDSLEPFFLMHPPAEIVCWWVGESEPPTQSQIRGWFHLPVNVMIHIRRDKIMKPNAEFVQKSFTMATNLQPHIALGLEKYPQAYSCLYGTLKFIDEHIPSLLKKLRMNSLWIPDSRVRLGNAALEQLNIISQSNECLLFWLNKTYTALGRRALRERILNPISELGELKTRFSRIEFHQENLGDSGIEKNLRSIYDLSRLHRKLHLMTVSMLDITHLIVTYSSIGELISKFSGTLIEIQEKNKVLEWMKRQTSPWDLVRMKTAGMDVNFDRTHPWVVGLYPELDTIEEEWVNLLVEIRKFLGKFTDGNTPLITITVGEVIPIVFNTTKKRYDKIKEEFTYHPTSSKSSSGTLDSREIQSFQKRANQIHKKWNNKQETVWLSTLDSWSSACEEFIDKNRISEYIVKWIANLDAEFALARCATEYGYVSPTFTNGEKSKLVVKGLRHPIIERIHTAIPYVKHDISLGIDEEAVGSAEMGLLIYGSNSSGKSSLMKAVGIAVLCAQTGIPVAASQIEITPYTGIYTRILGNDNLWAALSSFAVEMTEFRAILRYADNHSLILGDELCSGTETRSATAIVSAGIQTLVKRGAQFLFATHLHELSELEDIRSLHEVKFAHLGVETNLATKTITYKRVLESGPGSSLYGLEVCYGLDMDHEFLELANSIRNSKFSRYNSSVPVRECEVCKSEKELQTHHIIEQAKAKNGFVADGIQTHSAGNLVVLCELCHKNHHAGKIVINGWMSSSRGRRLDWQIMNSGEIPIKNSKFANHDSENSVISDHDLFEQIRLPFKVLLSKKKTLNSIVETLSVETGAAITLKMVKDWKKRLVV
jgi:DNA mismatch repair protein MutS